MDTAWKHTTVLLNEAVDALFSNPDESDDSIATRQTYVDATFGRGGHSRLILSRLQAQGRLIAFDKDPEALIEAASIHDSRFSIRHQGFSQLSELPAASIAGVLLDLGISDIIGCRHLLPDVPPGLGLRVGQKCLRRLNAQVHLDGLIVHYVAQELLGILVGMLANGRHCR